MSQTLSLPKVSASNSTPKYLQTREILLDAIRSGLLPPGTKLPSTEEISALVDVSLITAHKALDGLVRDGWLRREVGRGTFVREDLDPKRAAVREIHVGLLFHDKDLVNINDHYHSTLINELRQAAYGDKARRVEFFFQNGFDLRAKTEHNVGALCLHPPVECQREVEKLARRRPVLILGGTFPNARVPCVDCDNIDGGRQAVRHLVELGHRRIMFLSGPTNMTNARDRREGALAELAEHGIEPNPADLPLAADSVVLDDETRRHLTERLQSSDRPTAIIAGGFYLALATMQIIRQLGMDIPGNVSVVGFDDPTSASMLHPPLTTVRQPLQRMAGRAYESICRIAAESGARTRSCRLPAELVVRESTAAPSIL